MLLKCLAEDILTGLPQNLQILHVSQLESDNNDITVLEELLSSDNESTLILEEYKSKNIIVFYFIINIAIIHIKIYYHMFILNS